MNNRFENLTDGGDVGASIRVPRDAPPSMKRAAWEQLRRRVGNELLDALCAARNPCVVEVRESVNDAYLPGGREWYVPSDELAIRVRLTPVATSQITMFEPTPPDARMLKAMSPRAKLRTLGKLLRGAYLERGG